MTFSWTMAPHLLVTAPMDAPTQTQPRARGSSDVARSVRFVLETESITGTTLLVDGGQHLLRLPRDFSMMKP